MAKKHPRNEWEAAASGNMKYPFKGRIEQAGHEIKKNPPSAVQHTEAKFGKARARKQAVAIMLSKARKPK